MNAQQLRNSILQEAIEGRLVPQDPNDEPASVLLERIREEKKRLVKEGKLKKKDLEETPISEDEKPFEIPESWEWVRLGDAALIARGGSPRPIKEYITEDSNGLNWIKIGDTDKGGKYINSCKEKIKPEGLKKTRMVHPGDFLLTNSMSFGRPYITNIEGCIHDGWLMISPFANTFEQSYLYYVLSSSFARKQFNDKVAGAVVQNLNSDKVADSIIPLPPLAEQKRIVAKIEELLPKVEEYGKAQDALNKLNEELPERLKKSVLQEAIEGRLVPQDPNDEPASILLNRIREEKKRLFKEGKLKKKDLEETPISEDEKPFKAPNGWEWKRLSDLALDSADGPFGSNLKREHYTNDKEVRIIQLSNIGEDGWIDRNTKYTTFEHLKVISRSEAFAGDIIIAKMMPAGRAIICPSNDVKYVLSSDAVRFDFYKEIERKFLYYAINSKVFLNQVYSEVQGITRVRTSLSKLRTYVLPLPPLAEQKRIVAKIEELLPKVEEYGKAQEALDKLNEELPERLKKSILQEAIQGRLVPQDPNDEPASVLLDKIRKEKAKLVKEGKLKKKDLEETPISEDEKPFEIPESWEWVRLGVISTYAHTKKKINAVNAAPNMWGLDLEDIEKGGKLLSLKLVRERKAIGDKTFFSKGDILYSKLRPYLLKILIAPKDGICTPEIIPFTCYGNISKEYIVGLLKSAYVDNYINSVTFGIKMPRVATETMASLIVPLPPLAEQHRIVAKIEQLMKEIDKLKA